MTSAHRALCAVTSPCERRLLYGGNYRGTGQAQAHMPCVVCHDPHRRLPGKTVTGEALTGNEQKFREPPRNLGHRNAVRSEMSERSSPRVAVAVFTETRCSEKCQPQAGVEKEAGNSSDNSKQAPRRYVLSSLYLGCALGHIPGTLPGHQKHYASTVYLCCISTVQALSKSLLRPGGSPGMREHCLLG